MEDREKPQIHKYGESKTTRIMMATVCHGTFRPLDFCGTEGALNLNIILPA